MGQVSGVLSNADTVEVSYHFLIRELLSALEFIEAIQRTFTYKSTEAQHLNNW